MRKATIERNTKETQITVSVNLDGEGRYDITTGVGFLDHMLEQLSRHSLIDITMQAKGDTHIDFHHITEDCGYAIGNAISKALGDRLGIERYGNISIPMDETLTHGAVDLSNRPYLIWNVDFTRDKIGEMDTELFKEFFQALAVSLGANIHINNQYGQNNHHIIESSFKALARSLKKAITIDPRMAHALPTTKGALKT